MNLYPTRIKVESGVSRHPHRDDTQIVSSATPHLQYPMSTSVLSFYTTPVHPTNPPFSAPGLCSNLKAECSEHKIKVNATEKTHFADPVKWEDVVFHESDDDELITVMQRVFALCAGRDECCVED